MDKNIVRQILEDGKYEIVLEKRYRNYAWRFKLSNKTSVYCGDKNKVWIQGKYKDEVETYLLERLPSINNNRVFIVYGRDLSAKIEITNLLNSWDIIPYAIDQLPTQGRTIIEQLEHYIPQTNYGVIIASPDDIGYLAGYEKERKYRARQNVVLELGMLLSKLGRSRTAIIIKKCENFEKPSDIDGILYMEYETSIVEIADKLKKELNSNGYAIE